MCFRRLDYFVLSERLKKDLCDSLMRKDVMGSDHCPIVLLLSVWIFFYLQSPCGIKSHDTLYWNCGKKVPNVPWCFKHLRAFRVIIVALIFGFPNWLGVNDFHSSLRSSFSAMVVMINWNRQCHQISLVNIVSWPPSIFLVSFNFCFDVVSFT